MKSLTLIAAIISSENLKMIFFKEILKNKSRILEEIITFLFEDFYFYLMLISYLKYMKYEILKKKKKKRNALLP